MTLNPIVWYHALGGKAAKLNIIVAGIYAFVVILFAASTHYVFTADALPHQMPTVQSQFNAIWLIVISSTQGVFLLLLAPSALRKAVQRDFDTGMIESHRLSPMSNLKIVLGYLAGAPIQSYMLYGASLIFGTYFACGYGGAGARSAIGPQLVLGGWYFAQGCMLTLALLFLSAILLFALANRGKASAAGLIVLVGIFGGWGAVLFVPGVGLLLGLMSGGQLVRFLTRGGMPGEASMIVVAAGLQVVFSALLLAAASVQVRRPERPLFSLCLGWALAGVWGLTLVTGMRIAPGYDWMLREWGEHFYMQLTSSMFAFALVCMFPLYTAATKVHLYDQAKLFGESRESRGLGAARMTPVLAAMATTACMLLMYLFAKEGSATADDAALLRKDSFWAIGGAAILLLYWGAYSWTRFFKTCVSSPGLWLSLALAALTLGPLLVDGSIEFIIEEIMEGQWKGLGYIGSCSPVGTFVYLPKGEYGALLGGLVVQGAAAGLAAWLASRRRGAVGPGRS